MPEEHSANGTPNEAESQGSEVRAASNEVEAEIGSAIGETASSRVSGVVASSAESTATTATSDTPVERTSPVLAEPSIETPIDTMPQQPTVEVTSAPTQETTTIEANDVSATSQVEENTTRALPTPPTPAKNTHFLTGALTSLLEAKELKKSPEVKAAVQKALDVLNNGGSNEAHIIFDALKLTCETQSHSLKAKGVDIFAKVFDYGVFEGEQDIVRLTDASVDVISSCFDGEGTDPLVETQVLRALTNSILLMPCHGAALLKAVRQIYNIFIFSLSSDNQLIAQGTLNQVIDAVFSRINEKGLINARESKDDVTPVATQAHATHSSPTQGGAPLTLEKMNDTSNVDEDNLAVNANDEDLVVKDAFLIFRAMCKLSVKPLESETLDMRSHSARSKLLSLHIIHTILKDHIEIFLSHDVVILTSSASPSADGSTRLINAVRQYLCLSLSRNAASPLAPVFELSLEIFWLIISNLRSDFKREIPVFWDEIYLPVAEMKTSTPHQKRYLLSIIERLCNDSRCIIEFYLNYDCESSMPNICEKIIDYLSKLSLVRVEVSPQQKAAYREYKKRGISVYDISKAINLASGKMSSKPPEPDIYNHFPLEYSLKMESIGCTVGFLKSLFSWAQKANSTSSNVVINADGLSDSGSHFSLRDRSGTVESTNNSTAATPTRSGSFVTIDPDDPEQFESLKQRKKAFLEGVRLFNQNQKKGVKFLLENGFIGDEEPVTIAKFLLETDTLDKAAIGEYLGEGKDKNIAIMHAFVDQMDFTNLPFVDAMRRFLQSFRLPGEAQKIDRFMLKFAERYLLGNPSIFSNADAAYILAYSVILLNTDQHSPQVKNKMTFENFVMNNAGIDDGKDLPRDFLREIYDEIQSNEIKLQSEQHAALLSGDASLQVGNNSGGGFFGGRDLNREAYIHASKEMSTKTEKLVRSLGKKSGRANGSSGNATASGSKGDLVEPDGVFYVASHVYHVKSIFDTLWMSVLAGLTPPFKEYDDEDTCQLCLEGIKLSIRIACMFELEYARTSFIGALVQFENLNNYEEMKPKNVDAIHIMLDLAVLEGNNLQSSWTQILTSISQLERLQLIAQGVDQYSIPDVSIAKLTNRNSVETSHSSHRASTSFFSSFTAPSPTASQTASNKFHNQHLTESVAQLLTQTDLEVAMDKVFTNSANLSRDSIVEFVKALSQVASEEIESSGMSNNPRMFSLQKFVDVCYYNMGRIRVEWSHLWSIMGETFNEVGSNSFNSVIAFFALDSLRQLSMRFFQIEELSHFKFQKEFLKPFQYIMEHNESLEVKDMVLECLNNMILAKASSIKSGWSTIFGVLTSSASQNKESLVEKSFKIAKWINKEYLDVVIQQESFKDLVVCFTALAKCERFQRMSLLSLEVLSKLMHTEGRRHIKGNATDAETKSTGGSFLPEETLNKVWFPVLFAFHDIIMTGDELEVRSRALNHLFNILNEYGGHFEVEFWKEICHKLLFPIFAVLKNHWEVSNVDSNDKLSVWLSTTLIQALRNMISLFTHYFKPLSSMLDEYLTLLISCICQENDTIARIGRSCLQSLLIENCAKFNRQQWDQVTKAFSQLFDFTTAQELFTLDPSLPATPAHPVTAADKLRHSKEKSTIVVKCVLQLLMIETLSELFENDQFYDSVPYDNLIQLSKLLERSYSFARRFNDDYDLRVRLWNAGVIERLPNLLKQESSSSAVLINIMFRMYCDDDKTGDEQKQTIITLTLPLCQEITSRFSEFDEANQQRNITTWKPVVVEIFQGYVELDEEDFASHAPPLYSLTLRLLSKGMSSDLRLAIKSFLTRVGDVFVLPKEHQG
ncbi:SEC7 domain-containing protein [[Candida] zeylanoides]